MKCPRCGHWNKPSFPHCFRCGEPLGAGAPRTPEWRDAFEKPRAEKKRVVYDDTTAPVQDLVPPQARRRQAEPEPLSEEMMRLRDRRARGTQYLHEFRKNAAEKGIAPSPTGVTVQRGDKYPGVPDNPERTVQPHVPGDEADAHNAPESGMFTSDYIADHSHLPPAQPSRAARTRDGWETPRSMMGDSAYALYDADLPPMLDTPGAIVPAAKKRRSRRVRGPMLIAYALVGILVLSVVGFGVYAIASYVVPTLSTRTASTEKIENVFIEPIDMDGLPGRRIRVSGEEGSTIYIAELMKSFVVVGGFATFEIADYTFYDTMEHVDIATLDVSLTPTLVRGSTETRMESIRYTIDIPASPLQILQPEADRLTVNTSKYSIQMVVTPGSKVYVNGEDRSDTVMEDGSVTANPSILAIGDNIINITVRAPYCRETNRQLVLYRAPQEIPLELHAATLTYTTDQRLTIYATTQVGATITIESPHFERDFTQVDVDGSFWVAAKMGRVGNNTIVIRASYEGKKDSIIEHVVYYLPPASDYTPKAWALNASDYNELMNNIAMRTENAQIYLCQGVIKEILSGKPQLAIMDTGKDGREQLVLLEYQCKNSDEPWAVGNEYRVYADVSGVYDKIPRLVGRYTYTEKVAEENKPAAAEGTAQP